MEGTGNLHIVGIGGVSNGGKTTLCKSLTDHLIAKGAKVKIIHQDDYFKKPEDVPWHDSREFRLWDDLEALDMLKMVDDVYIVIDEMKRGEGVSVLIMEGFLLFNHKLLNSLFDRRYFLTLTKDVAWERRSKRVYEPPDTDTIFDNHVWPMYLTYYDRLKRDYVELVELDGSSTPEGVLRAVIGDIESVIENL